MAPFALPTKPPAASVWLPRPPSTTIFSPSTEAVLTVGSVALSTDAKASISFDDIINPRIWFNNPFSDCTSVSRALPDSMTPANPPAYLCEVTDFRLSTLAAGPSTPSACHICPPVIYPAKPPALPIAVLFLSDVASIVIPACRPVTLEE